MTIIKDTMVTVKDGNFRISMGTALTTFYAKEDAGSENSKFVLRTEGEIDRLILMLQTAKETMKTTPQVITEVEVSPTPTPQT
jgi:hypothetical protein